MKKYLVYFMSPILFITGCASAPATRLLPQPELQGHRGARGLAPENTWSAFKRGLTEGVTVLELDTNVTKDLKLVVHHDSEINPTICRFKDGTPTTKTPIRNYTLEQLKTLDCGSQKNPDFPEQTLSPGERLISLDEFFEKFSEAEKKDPALKSILFNIEAKFPGVPGSGKVTQQDLEEFATLMSSVITHSGFAPRVTVQSFAIEVLPLVKQKVPQVRTSALFQPSYWQGFRMYIGLGSGVRDDILQKAIKVNADVISPYWLYCNSDFITQAHSHQIAVIAWTVNDEKKMRELFINGIDGLISDYPNRLVKVAKSL